jgi:hypothetical protein
MKKLEVDTRKNNLPMVLPQGIEAICLDRSVRGGGRHGVFLLKSPQNQWVVKIYHHKRGPLQRFFSGLENYFAGRSPLDPRARFSTEKKTLDIWQENGFEVFRRLSRAPSVTIDFPHLAFEFVCGRTLKEYFLDSAIGKADKLNTFERFLPEWSRRHAVALKTRNHYLIQERATLQHVFMSAEDGRLIYYDFEIVYTPRHSLPAIIAREIAGYIRSLFSVVPRDDFNDYLNILIRDYPHRDFLHYPYDYFFRHPNRLLRLIYSLDRQLPRNHRQHSKYNVTLKIQDCLYKTS